MAKESEKFTNIKYRIAQPADAKLISRLIFDTFPKFAAYMIGLGDAERAKQIIAKLFLLPGHRFSYEFTQVVMHGERLVGMFIAYPGRDLLPLNWRLARLLLKEFTLMEKIKLIRRGLPVLFIQEAARDEYLLSNLAMKKGLRGKGIGAQVLSHVENKAKKAGYHKLALMVTIDNQDARRFYEGQGFVIKAIHLESNRRVRYLGPGYQKMLKELG
jgi:ribosomal protein S18 acetylase RimI-like enzyme